MEEDCKGIAHPTPKIHIPFPLIIGMIITPFAKGPTSVEEVVAGTN
jgi:hypothetical protein